MLSHHMEDGSEKPIAFASCSLAPVERKYAQLNKEDLAVSVWGAEIPSLSVWLSVRDSIRPQTPTTSLFSESCPVPAMGSARLQRWALTLSPYNYMIAYKPGESHANADVLSRWPLPEAPQDIPLPGETILLLDTLHEPVSATNIK